MAKQSAGILLFRKEKELEVFLVHPGGPFFAKKDLGAWSIPKGEYLDDEDPLEAAKREFTEETGFSVEGKFIVLAPVKLKSGKIIKAWAVEGDVDAAEIVSNTFEMIWPPKSETTRAFPEVDKAGWFNIKVAREKINERQAAFLTELEHLLK